MEMEVIPFVKNFVRGFSVCARRKSEFISLFNNYIRQKKHFCFSRAEGDAIFHVTCMCVHICNKHIYIIILYVCI